MSQRSKSEGRREKGIDRREEGTKREGGESGAGSLHARKGQGEGEMVRA
jgi:hypothetical protein